MTENVDLVDVDWNNTTVSQLKEVLSYVAREVLTIVDEDEEHVIVIAKKEFAQSLIKVLEEISEWIE